MTTKADSLLGPVDLAELAEPASGAVAWEPHWKAAESGTAGTAGTAAKAMRSRPAWQSSVRPAWQSSLSLLWRMLSPAVPRPASDVGRKTAYLDGLRGFAAFLVYWHHHQLWAHETVRQDHVLEDGFGFEGRHHLAAFPFVRNFFQGGHFAVAVFFVVSGYVLSATPLRLVHEGEHGRLADKLASALFRRWIRLFVPVLVTTFIYMSSWHLFGGIYVANAEPRSGWAAEAWAWYCELKNFSFVFNQGGRPWLSYNFPLWSIPVEFKGSVVVYTSLLALSRLRRLARLGCQLVLIFYFLYVSDAYYCAMFVAGMLLCDLDLLAGRQQLPRLLVRLGRGSSFIFPHLLVLGLYLGGVPARDSDVGRLGQMRGWYYLSLLKPQAVFDYKWFYLFWAAVLLVAAIPRTLWLRRFFETAFCQYLGRISFAFYLVHGPVRWTVGDRIYAATGWHTAAQRQHMPGWVDLLPLSKAGPLGLEPAFLLPHLLILPLTLWLAAVVTRLVDEPSVRFAQWLYGRLLADKAKSTILKK